MTTTTTTDETAIVIAGIDQFLRVVAAVRQTNPRDPLRALEDRLLELRAGVEAEADVVRCVGCGVRGRWFGDEVVSAEQQPVPPLCSARKAHGPWVADE